MIGLICKLMERAYEDRTVLASWQNANPSGRGRRSEKREAAIAVGQFLMTHWFQLESRRCATPSGGYQLVPDVKHLARRISEHAKDWKQDGTRLSQWRIQTVFEEWTRAGYITSKQQRMRKPSGDWEACPAVRTFTKKFFLELGGRELWERVRKAGSKKLKRIAGLVSLAGMTVREYVSPGVSLSPKSAHRLRKNPWFFTEMDEAARVRKSNPYQRAYTEKVVNLGCRHVLEARPPDRWSEEKLTAVARKQTDKLFGLA